MGDTRGRIETHKQLATGFGAFWQTDAYDRALPERQIRTDPSMTVFIAQRLQLSFAKATKPHLALVAHRTADRCDEVLCTIFEAVE